MKRLALQTLCLMAPWSMAATQSTPAPGPVPAIVQPGAPGQPSRRVSAEHAIMSGLTIASASQTDFMRGMLVHHGQAVEMVALIAARSHNPELALIGRRISASQSDEMKVMERWLAALGEPAHQAGTGADEEGMDDADAHHAHMDHGAMADMPAHDMAMARAMHGMLSPAQMAELRAASGQTFDRLFLEGMIQHHQGAIAMVAALFADADSDGDPEVSRFAGDIVPEQSAEIAAMQLLLRKL